MTTEDFIYDHVQLYVHKLDTLETYKKFEEECNALSERVQAGTAEKQNGTLRIDFVFQLIAAFGYRVTGYYDGPQTRNVLISSGGGARFLVTAAKEVQGETEEKYAHFRAEYPRLFLQTHASRQGCGVLAFSVPESSLVAIVQNYKTLHPKCIRTEEIVQHSNSDGSGFYKYFECYAYYDQDGERADPGTLLRFVAKSGYDHQVLPGLDTVDAKFPVDAYPAFFDHWVSNVHSRTSFIATLKDVLSFSTKVDFNAGVVAAGEAIIESTVIGNNSPFISYSADQSLADQSQIYLPINNSLSEVGHVHLFLKELGQGIQHLASRVLDLVTFVERANKYRELLREGLTFLRIPRSYYGALYHSDLISLGMSPTGATALLEALSKANLIDVAGVVNLELEDHQLLSLLEGKGDGLDINIIVEAIKKSRYINMHKLLKSHLPESTYLRIVKNQVLVDIQGEDVLFQIFTQNILQEKAEDEAPFLEFIQRVCSTKFDENGLPKPVRPGCGGFGIRNFLTLFLSIEVSKAMQHLAIAIKEKEVGGDAQWEEKRQKREERARQMIDTLTKQLNEANPILTRISDAMTAEAIALEELAKPEQESREKWESEVQKNRKEKEEAQAALVVCSKFYADAMQTIRLNYAEI